MNPIAKEHKMSVILTHDYCLRRQAERSRKALEQIKAEGKHCLQGAEYWPSYRGSRVLAPILEKVKAQKCS